MSSWFQNAIVHPGKLRLFCFLMAFIAGFVVIRISVRLIRAQVRWWPGNVTPGGMHIHHMVFGVVFMCLGGISGLAVRDTQSVWAAVTAALFGLGTALVLDEFALALHLEDVYWSEQGRLSVQVVFIAAAMCGLALVGFAPFGVDGGSLHVDVLLYLLVNLVMTVICMAKGKPWLGLLGVYLTIPGLVGAIRLARPGSPWARTRYQPGSRKLDRATARESRYAARLSGVMTWLGDLVAGRPDRR